VGGSRAILTVSARAPVCEGGFVVPYRYALSESEFSLRGR
jgi:hypothetical protein